MSKASFRRLIKLQGYEITIKRVEGSTTEEVTVVAAQSMWDQKSGIDEANQETTCYHICYDDLALAEFSLPLKRGDRVVDSKDNKIRNIMSVHPLKYHGEIVGYKLETRG